jgi:hypothetical protein
MTSTPSASQNPFDFGTTGLSLPLTIAAAQTASFNVTFIPTAAGAVTGTLSLVSNASNSPTSISLSATGLTVLLSITPTTINFGNVLVGSTGSESVSIQNTGTVGVQITQIQVTGTGFNLSGVTLPITLAAGQTTSFTVTFTPTTVGNVSGTLTVTSNATNSPTSVPVDGTGTTHYVTLTWTASTSTVAGYNIYRATSSGAYTTPLNSTLIPSSTCTPGCSYMDTNNVQSGNTYYYVATAMDSANNESVHSNEVSATVP